MLFKWKYSLIWLFIAAAAKLLLSHFSRVRLCVTPHMAAHQAPLSRGFSRQEHWSGLPFPSAMHESEKWKWSRSVVSDCSQPHGLQPTRPSMGLARREYWSGVPLPFPMGFSRQEYWSGLPFPPPADLLNPEMELTSPASPVSADRFFTSKPPLFLQLRKRKYLLVQQFLSISYFRWLLFGVGYHTTSWWLPWWLKG